MTRSSGESVSTAEPPQRLKRLRVVVADDDRDTALTLAMILGEEGHDARAVYAGRNVMGAVLDFDPDVVVLDIHMPGLSGWEVARTIRDRRGKERPLLIGISGEYKMGADKILSEILGFDHYLLKPCEPRTVLALLEPLRTPVQTSLL
jgi:DNA-binding response OmpR family regulator